MSGYEIKGKVVRTPWRRGSYRVPSVGSAAWIILTAQSKSFTARPGHVWRKMAKHSAQICWLKEVGW